MCLLILEGAGFLELIEKQNAVITFQKLSGVSWNVLQPKGMSWIISELSPEFDQFTLLVKGAKRREERNIPSLFSHTVPAFRATVTIGCTDFQTNDFLKECARWRTSTTRKSTGGSGMIVRKELTSL